MANIPPVVSSSTSLITSGWPMASVENSNPVGDIKKAAGASGTAQTVVRQKALAQSRHISDRVV